MMPSVLSITIGVICLACSGISRADVDYTDETPGLRGENVKHKIKDQNDDYEEEYEREGPGFKSKVKEKSKPGEYEYEEEMEYEDAFGKKRTIKFKRKCIKGVCEDEYQD